MFLILSILATMGAIDSPLLVETEKLSALKSAIIVDARSADAFAEGHIPGAAHIDVNSLSEEQNGVVGMLKPAKNILPLLAAAGLEPDKPIVVYSGLMEASDMKRATRLFWALEYLGFSKVRLLNGGLNKWRAEGRPVVQGKSTVNAVALETLSGLTAAKARYATRVDVSEAQKGIVVDLRSAEYFSGGSKKAFVKRGGHIPGARNVPAPTLLEGEQFIFKSAEELRDMLGSNTEDVSTPVLTYCNTGRDATVGYVAYRLAGFTNVAVYDASMAEWGNHAECPLSTDVDK